MLDTEIHVHQAGIEAVCGLKNRIADQQPWRQLTGTAGDSRDLSLEFPE